MIYLQIYFFLKVLITSLTALSILRLICTAFSFLDRLSNPKLIISLANNVDVVVPSPALSAVCTAACFTN